MSVFVTGGTGFIALHIIDQLLAKSYPVITTVRSTTKGDDLVAKFAKRYPEGKLSYEVVEDIGADDAFSEALKKNAGEIKYVLHTASPFSYGNGSDYETVFVKPAVKGTVGLLESVAKYAPNVQKVVITSSFAAIWNYGDSKLVHTEKTWSPLTWEQAKDNEMLAYCYSKKEAESQAWKFVETQKPSFKLTTVNPPLVAGPQCFDENATGQLNTSANYVKQLLDSTPADDGKLFGSFSLISADVRDVAAYHIIALDDALAGERLVPNQGNFTEQKALNYINDSFPELKGKISIGKPDGVEELEAAIPLVDFSRSAELTKLKLISFEDSIQDATAQILKAGQA